LLSVVRSSGLNANVDCAVVRLGIACVTVDAPGRSPSFRALRSLRLTLEIVGYRQSSFSMDAGALYVVQPFNVNVYRFHEPYLLRRATVHGEGPLRPLEL